MKRFLMLKRFAHALLDNYRTSPKSLEDQLYQAIIRSGDVVFDIGANYGSASLYMAHLSGARGQVIAFEPIPTTFAKLCRNIRLDFRPFKAKIHPLQLGVSDREQRATFNMPGSAAQSASLAEGAQWQSVIGVAEGHNMNTFECDCVTLDGMITAQKVPHPQVLKIDVEGAEMLVLDGAGQLLRSPQPPILLVEIFAPWERAFGYAPYDVLSKLQAIGYTFLFVCPDGLRTHTPTPQQPIPPEYVHGYNVLAYNEKNHRDRVATLRPLLWGGGGRLLAMSPAPMLNQ
jgi:FkbM family methyltransferase